MKSNSIKPLAAAIGASFLASALAPVAAAGENPFALTELKSGYQLAQGDATDTKPAEGKCGEGKCGDKKPGEGKCGDKKPAEDKEAAGDAAKGGEGKCCHEGNCGGATS